MLALAIRLWRVFRSFSLSPNSERGRGPSEDVSTWNTLELGHLFDPFPTGQETDLTLKFIQKTRLNMTLK